jgi:hypothetical protein
MSTNGNVYSHFNIKNVILQPWNEYYIVDLYNRFGLEILEYGRMDPSRWPRGTLYPQKLALTSPTSGGRSVAIVRLRTKATE